MPIPLFNSIASWLLKKRYHQIELFLKYPAEVQQEVLQQLLNLAEETEIGKRYEFESITDYETYNNRVPIVTYEEMEPLIGTILKKNCKTLEIKKWKVLS